MDTQRIESIVIGTGITGSILVRTLKTKGLDKATRAGGRCSSGRIGNNCIFDKGATFLKNTVDYKHLEIDKKFNLEKFIKLSNAEVELIPHPTHPDLVAVKPGMSSLVDKILMNQDVNFNTKVRRIEKIENEFLVICEDKKFITPIVFCTSPLQQTFDLLETGEIKESWKNFTSPFSEYKKTLVFTAYWESSKIKDSTFSEISHLNPGNEIEYYTIESEKTGRNSYLILSIQFSENFSEIHFDNWTEHEKYPNKVPKDLGMGALKKLFTENGMEFLPPDDLRIHRWKFAAPKISMFNKDSSMDFDSIEFKNYISLCKQTSFIPIGDWIFGQRVTKCISGTLVSLSLLGYSLEWVGETLT